MLNLAHFKINKTFKSYLHHERVKLINKLILLYLIIENEEYCHDIVYITTVVMKLNIIHKLIDKTIK